MVELNKRVAKWAQRVAEPDAVPRGRYVPQAIELSKSEKVLLDQIELDPKKIDHSDWLRNGTLVCDLMHSLLGRRAIPEARIKYFIDPEYNPGGKGTSREGQFERNGTEGDAIFKHAHFLEFLWYFLYGARLPTTVIAKFQSVVTDCGPITSGDAETLRKCARDLTRAYNLAPAEKAEEFCKLSLDCGLSLMYAMAVRNAVKSVRSR